MNKQNNLINNFFTYTFSEKNLDKLNIVIMSNMQTIAYKYTDRKDIAAEKNVPDPTAYISERFLSKLNACSKKTIANRKALAPIKSMRIALNVPDQKQLYITAKTIVLNNTGGFLDIKEYNCGRE